MLLGLGLSVLGGGRASRFDAEDLVSGTVSVDFTALNDVTVDVDFTAGIYRAWVDDPTWPYGLVGVFKGKA